MDDKTLLEKIIAVEGSELYAYLEGLSLNNASVRVPRYTSLSTSMTTMVIDEWERRILTSGQRAWVKIRRKDE